MPSDLEEVNSRSLDCCRNWGVSRKNARPLKNSAENQRDVFRQDEAIFWIYACGELGNKNIGPMSLVGDRRLMKGLKSWPGARRS
jgi:hypothetical protein